MALLFEREGAEILANTTTSGAQGGGKVAALSGGGFVAVWQDNSGAGGDPDTGIKAQRFDAAGNKVGSEFLINSSVAGNQLGASVVGLTGGRFVVTWNDLGTAGADTDGSVKGRVFAADGTPLGSEFLANTTPTGAQAGASISALAGGGFVLAWQDPSGVGGDASGTGIKAQLFDANGAKVGGEFLANTTTAGGQFTPQVAGLAGGGFAISWSSSPGGGMVQMFDSAGTKVGAEQSLVVGTPLQAIPPRVDALDTGFLVTWAEMAYNGDPLGFEIKAQRFGANGVKAGSVFAIGAGLGSQFPADIRALPGGGFIAIWNALPDGTTSDVFAQVFDSNGQEVGSEFVVNATAAGNQSAGAVELLASGDLAVVWTEGTAPATEVRIQLLKASIAGASDIAISTNTVSETAIENLAAARLSASGGALNATYSYTIVSDTTGAFGIDGDKLIVIDNSLLDFETAPTAQVRVRATDNDGHQFEETLTVNIADAAIEVRYAADDVFSGQGVDEFFDTVTSVTPLASGGFVIVRSFLHNEVYFEDGVRAQIFDADGQPVGSDFVLDIPVLTPDVSVAALPDGGFVVAFTAEPDGLGFCAKVQRFDAAGNEVGGETRLDPGIGGFSLPRVAVLEDGGFVVTWEKTLQDSGPPTHDVYAQLFDATGATVGGEFLVHTASAQSQRLAEVAALPGGGFVVVWRDYDASGTDPGYVGAIKGQFFSAAGAKTGSEFTVLADDTGVYGGLELTVLGDGTLVVGWLEDIDYDAGIYANGFQLVGANGTNIGGPVPVAVYVTGGPEQALTATPDGGFVVTWTGINPAGSDPDDTLSWARFFDASGAAVGDTFVIEDSPAGFEGLAQVGALASGDLVFAWSRLFQRDSDGAFTSDAYARIVRPTDAGTPGDDRFELDHPGAVTVDGRGGDDAFYFGAEFTAADKVDGGAGTNDQIGLEGNYTGANALVLGANTIANVEVIAVLPGFDYSITTVDANVPAGGTLKVFGGNLGAGDNLTFNGSAELDGNFMVYGGAGTDLITTGAGIDGIYFGPGKFNPSVDRVDGGTGSNDQLALDGHYTLTLDGTAIHNIDVIALMKGVTGDLATYNLTLANSLIGAGQTMTVWGVPVETAMTINGSAETDGSIKLFGGSAGDTLTGGTGNDWFWGGLGGDTLTGGLGADTFSYTDATESAGTAFDRLVGFNDSADVIDLPFAVAGFATPVSGTLNAASMSASLQGTFAGLGAHQAAVFTATGGDMNGRVFVLVDADGATGYQAGTDYLIELVSPVSPIDQVGMFV